MVYFQRGSLSGETSGEQAGDFKFDREIRSSATPFTEMGQANLLEVLPEDTDSVLKDSTYHHEKHLQLPSDRGLYDGIIQRHDWPLVCPPYTGPAGRFSWQSSLGLHHGESPTTPSDSQSYIPTSIPVMGDLLSASSVYQQSRHPFLLQNHDLLVQPPKNLWVEDARSLSDSASPTPYSPRPYSESLDINIDLEELGEHTSSSEEVMVQEKLGDVPYAQLIYSALMEAPGNRMVLRDIYHWIERNTDKANNPEFTGWQNSVRHNLSMNKAFKKVEFISANHKRGYIWVLEDSAVGKGIKPTTRYRKKDSSKKTPKRRVHDLQRRQSGRRGGQAAGRLAKAKALSHYHQPWSEYYSRYNLPEGTSDNLGITPPNFEQALTTGYPYYSPAQSWPDYALSETPDNTPGALHGIGYKSDETPCQPWCVSSDKAKNFEYQRMISADGSKSAFMFPNNGLGQLP